MIVFGLLAFSFAFILVLPMIPEAYAAYSSSLTVTNIIQSNPGPTSATVNYTPSAQTDGNTVSVSCSPPSGSSFTANTATTVTCTFQDGSGVVLTFKIFVDTAAPTVTSVSSTVANGAYLAGATIPVTITFSEPVTVTGIPQIQLETGATDRQAAYASGSGTATLTFNYVVQAGDTSADLNYVATTSLTLNGGTIKDYFTNNAVLTLPTLLGANSLGTNKDIVIDTAAPPAPVINVPAASTSVNTATPTISGTAEAGTTVTVVEGPTTLGTAIATGGSWSLTSSSLIDGPHTITATATDAAGHISPASPERAFSVDTVVPITATPVIAPNATNAAPTITSTATDASPSSNIAQAEYFIDSVGASGTGIAMSASDGLFNSTSEGLTATLVSDTFTGLAQGTHTIYVNAKDGAGNWGTATSTTFVKDTVAATVTASPAGGVYTTPQSVTLTANETATIYYTIDGSTPTTGSTPYTGSPITININTILKFIAQDTVGNTGAVAIETYSLTGTSVASTTGAGTVNFSTGTGSFASISAISESSLPTSGKPGGITFDYGFFSWTVTGLTAGQSVAMTVTYPAAIPENTQYWTVIGSSWINLTPLMSSNDGDNVLVLTITDGGMGDEDGSPNGQISDPGGSATIVDITPPSITAPVDIAQEASGPLTTLVTLGTPTVSDNVDPSPNITNNAPPGGFPLGNTIVTWTATDDAGNSAIDTQTVTLTDTTLPTITLPPDATVEATAQLTSLDLGSPTVGDLVDGTPSISNNAPPGGFPVGTTNVTWTATDDSGNSANATQTVTITDTTAPTITAPANVTAEATGPLTSVALGSPTVSDIADPSPTITNNAPPGGFPVGTTNVIWTATDDVGNSATTTQTVTITDTTAPTITAPAGITQEATGEFTSITLGSPSASDVADPTLTLSNNAPPGGFTVGTTNVTWTATDDSGNSANATQTVIIGDTAAPSIVAPPDISTAATGEFTTINLGSPTVSDVADPTVTISNDSPSGGFPVSTIIVTWTATDDSGNTAADTQVVTVTDTGAPSITAPPDIAQEATTPLSSITLGTPTVSDDEDPTPTVTNNAPAGGFPVGTTIVTWTATDDSGNAATAGQTVTITDTTDPSITAPGAITTEATAPLTTISLGSPVVSDVADPTPTVTNNAPAGGFPVGTTIVTWTATDDSGNSATATQTVTITDTTAPTITAPANITAEATGPLTSVALGTPSASDIADPTLTLSNNAPPGGFTVGTTNVTWTATDDSGNSASDTQLVTITDTGAPSITAPANVTVEATAPLSIIDIGSPTVSDVADPSPTVSNDAPVDGFPIGTTIVTWIVSDDSGNSATAAQMVNVVDTSLPSITAPADLIQEATGEFTSITLGSPSASDVADPTLILSNNAPPGGFTVGTTNVTWTATDDSGNSANATQTVTITDTTAPTITAPANVTAEATGPLTSFALGSPSVSDIADPSPTVTNNAPPGGFPVGTTNVTWTATDDVGNFASVTQSVTITDTIAPSITAPIGITQEATGPLTPISLGSATTSDIADPTVTVSNDAPTEGFSVGTTTVTWTATDDSGNSATATQTVSITDTTAPTITAPANITAEATAELTAIALGSPTVGDIADPSPTITNNAPPGGFPVGITTVTWTATDDSGNFATAAQTVTITDTTAPSITAPAAVTTEATGEFTPVTLGSPTVSDLADPSPTVTNNAPAGGFPVGITTVTWTATDDSGNSATAAQTVTITDTTAPSITAPSDISTPATGEYTEITIGSPTVNDLVDATPSVANNAPAGGFPVGVTTVTWTATDDAGNTASNIQIVTVTDTGAPSITAPLDITLEATGQFTSVDLGSPVVSDDEDPSPTVTNNAPSEGFPVGTTIATWTASDDSGNSATATQSVTITDTTDPSITASSAVTIEASALLTPVTLSSPTVSDIVDQTITVTNNAPPGGFPVGITTVTWTATDDSGNFATAAQTVTITDTTPPSITAPAPVTTEATGEFTPVTLGSPTASDLVDSNPTVTNNAPPGGFPVGATIVTWTATDDSGNSATSTQTVTITDTAAPSITAPAGITQEATAPLNSVSLGSAIASDIADQTITVTNNAPAGGFPVGVTTVTWTATDDSGNSATAAQTVTITDTTAPSITAPAGITQEATGQFTPVTLGSPTASDLVDSNPTVTKNAPPGGFPVGITTVTWTATDYSGNSATATQTITIMDTTPPTVTASPASGTYSSPQAVTLSASDLGSSSVLVYYTTNGDTPTTLSTLYSGSSISVAVDTTLKFIGVDASSNSGTVVTETYALTGTSVPSATGTGPIAITTNLGSFESISAVSESSLPTAGKPAGLTFEHGFTSFLVTGITPGGSITLTITYPAAVPANSQFWAVDGGTWVDLTSQLGSNDGDSVITLTKVDGGLGDEDGVVNGQISDPSGLGYVADSTPPTVTASPVGGTYSTAQAVTLSANEPGTAIYYTTNGATPTTSSTLYAGIPLSISTDTTLKFFGKDPAGNESPVSTAVYDINPAPAIVMQDTTTTTGWGIYSTRPVLSEYVSGTSTMVGKQIDSITVNVKKSSSTATGTAQIGIINPDLSMKKVFATINIATLTTSYTPYEYSLSSGDTYTIQAGDRVGVKNTGGTSTSNYIAIMRDTNTADPFDGANTYLSYYTTSWTAQTTFDLTMTLKYSGGASGGSDTTPPTVTASPTGGSYNTAKLVTLTSNEPATIYYTNNGNTPTTSSPIYSGSPLSITTTTTLKFFGVDIAGNPGTVQTQIYTIDNTPPTISASPLGGSYTSVQTVTLTSSESGTVIYYTTNGANPTTASPVYSAPIQLTSTTTLKFFGNDAAGNSGSIVTELYTLTIPDTTPPTITASPVGSTFGPSGTTVTLSANEPATIYYTTNGDTPTESSTTYTSPISITTTTTLKYFGKDTAGNPSSVQSQTYTIDSVPPTVSASPLGGSYASSQSVTLSSSESGTTIRYTTNGNDPTSSSPQYAGPISISADTTLKFYGTDNFGNVGSIVIEIYDITAPPQPPGILMQDLQQAGDTGWGIYSTRPVLSEFVSSTSVLVGKQIDSITVNIKKSESTAVGTAQVGIINSDLSMKKVFASIDISTLTTSYVPKEFLLPSGDNYIIEAGDRIGIKYTGGSSSGGNYIAIMRDINTSDPFNGANTYLSYYTTSWTAQITYDLVMTLKLID